MYPKSKSVQRRLEQDKQDYLEQYNDATFINDIDFSIYEKNIDKWALKLLKEQTTPKTFGAWGRGINKGARWVEIFTKEQALTMQTSINERKAERTRIAATKPKRRKPLRLYQRSAKQKALNMLDESFCVLDVSTTGLSADDEIVEISLIDKFGNCLIDTLIKPSKSIPASATAIHGITDNDVINAPSFSEIYPDIIRFMKNRVCVAYNASFDFTFLSTHIKNHDLKDFSYSQQCAMLLFSEFTDAEQWQKLTTAIQHFDIQVEKTHRSYFHCKATLALIKAIANFRNEV